MNANEPAKRMESSLRRPALLRASLLVVLLATCGQLCACAGPHYVMHVESFAQPVSFGKRYVILPGLMNVKVDDPAFQAVAAHLDTMLAAKGYVRAAGIDEADLGLYVVYGVRERRGEGFRVRASLSLEGGRAGMPLAGADVVQMGVPGPVRRGSMIEERVFVRALEIEAVDLARYKANDPANIVWKVALVSPGSTVSLEKAMPYFLAALSEFIGKRAFVDVQISSDYTISVIKPDKPHRP